VLVCVLASLAFDLVHGPSLGGNIRIESKTLLRAFVLPCLGTFKY